jgi:CTP synthase
MKKNHKYIFVLGGVISGVGKGVSTSSIGILLESKGYKVNMVKIDPYLNVDAGTMNPTEHGEVFVLDSGLETDQDMGNYERFLGHSIDQSGYMTGGLVYKSVIDRERSLGYGGKCVQVIPDLRDEIIGRIKHSAIVTNSDVTLIEIGGTVGDFENVMFMESARVMKISEPEHVMCIMVSYLPVPGKLGEMKSKPTQNALRQLNSCGLSADMIIARSEQPMDDKRREKIAVSCGLKTEAIISAPDVDSIYDIPRNFEKSRMSSQILRILGLPDKKQNLAIWDAFVKKTKAKRTEIHIAIVGKYFDSGDFTLSDSYLSVIEAIKFSGYELGIHPRITWVNAKDFEKTGYAKRLEELSVYDGIIVPGGFGETGIEGKLRVIQYAREQHIPYFGLCYGMQLLCIEYARNVAGCKGAHTAEINSHAPHVIIDILEDQKKHLLTNNFGGSMRLGSYPAHIKKGTLAEKAYTSAPSWPQKKQKDGTIIHERHRHRYEVSPQYTSRLETAGLVFSGTSPDGVLAEIAELPRSAHPFFLGTQYHPEFLARPLAPHPLFTEFIRVASKQKQTKK